MAFEYNDTARLTLLVRAIINNDSFATEEALKKGFDVNLPDNQGWTPLHIAAANDTRVTCLQILLSHPLVRINLRTFLGETALFVACKYGCYMSVKRLLKHPKCDVNLSDTECVSPLHIACNNNNLRVISLLLKCGANVNSEDFNGYTPLHEIVGSSNSKNTHEVDRVSVISNLLSNGANPDLTDHEGNSPLHLACQNGLLDSVKLLHKSSRKHNVVNCCNNDGRSPLFIAVTSQNIALLEYLLSEGADANIVDLRGLTALHVAAHSGSFEVFSTILQATSDECISKYCTFNEERDYERLFQTKRINSLICLALDSENIDFLVSILKCGINNATLTCPVVHAEDVVHKTFTLHSPIAFLLECKMYDLGLRTIVFLATLIDHGLPIRMVSCSPSISYVNPLCATLVGLNDCPQLPVIQCLRLLLECGADPDSPNESSLPSPFEHACIRTCTEAVLLLLQHSNLIEPQDVLKWIEQNPNSNQEEMIEHLLPLAPYYRPNRQVEKVTVRKELLAPQVHSLLSCCRSVIREQLHEESGNSPEVFSAKLSSLGLPKAIRHFLRYK